MKKISGSFLLVILSICLCAQENDLCQSSTPVCANSVFSFQASTGGFAQTGPCYGCLLSQPNPTWFYFKVSVPGEIVLTIFSQPQNDIDFVCWGPFDDPHSICDGGLSEDKVVSCSYSTSPVEECTVFNAVDDAYYVLLITNFSNSECSIVLTQTAGNGATDCCILPFAVSSNSPVCANDTLRLFADTIPSASYFWQGPDGFTSTYRNPVIPDAKETMAGEYFCFVSSVQYSDTSRTEVIVHPRPSAHIDGNQEICQRSTADLQMKLTGTPPWSAVYAEVNLLSDDTTLQFINTDQSLYTWNVSPEHSMKYVLLQVSDKNCMGTVSGSAQVIVFPVPVAEAGNKLDVVYGTTTQLDGSVTGGSPPFVYSWCPSDLLLDPGVEDPVTVSLTHPVEFTLNVTDQNGCTCSDQVQVNVSAKPLSVTIASESDDPVCPGEVVMLTAEASGGTNQYQYVWTDESGAVLSNSETCLLRADGYSSIISVEIFDGNSSITHSVDVFVHESPVVNLIPDGYHTVSQDTVNVCVYDDIIIHAGDPGLQYRWFDGSTHPELKLFTSGVGIDAQTIWLEVTNPVTGCVYTDTLYIIYDFAACVGVGDLSDERPIRLFPNPVSDRLFCRYEGIRDPVRLVMVNLAGQVVHEENLVIQDPGIHEVQLDLAFLPKGMYLLKLVSTTQCHVEKIILQ